MDLATAQLNLATWQAAVDKLSRGQTVTHNGRTVSRYMEATKERDKWQLVVNNLQSAAQGDETPGLVFGSWNF